MKDILKRLLIVIHYLTYFIGGIIFWEYNSPLYYEELFLCGIILFFTGPTLRYVFLESFSDSLGQEKR